MAAVEGIVDAKEATELAMFDDELVRRQIRETARLRSALAAGHGLLAASGARIGQRLCCCADRRPNVEAGPDHQSFEGRDNARQRSPGLRRAHRIVGGDVPHTQPHSCMLLADLAGHAR